MWSHNTQLADANVVTAFDNQDDADEAILVLRLSGFQDDQIGYYSWTSTGGVVDLLERNYWMIGAAIGTIIGAALGVWFAYIVVRWSDPSRWGLDLVGLAIICGSAGAFAFGFVGGAIGLDVPKSLVIVPELGTAMCPFILAVRAGATRDQALTIIHQHGGHELRPDDFAPPPPAHFRTGHAA